MSSIVVSYGSRPPTTVDLDRASVVTVDGPRNRERGDTQSRDSHALRNPRADLDLVSLALAGGVLTAVRVDNGGAAVPVGLLVDGKSVVVADGPGRVAGGLDRVNRITRRVSLSGAVSVVFEKVA